MYYLRIISLSVIVSSVFLILISSFLNAEAALLFEGNHISGDTGNSRGAVMGDVDGDGDLDIYVANDSNQQNKLWMNNGLGGFTANNISGDTGNSACAVMGDVDGDNDLDIYVGNTSNQQNKLWINNGSGSFTANNITGDLGASYDCVMGDVDGDSDLDIYVANYGNIGSAQNKLWINNGSGSFTANDITGDLGSSYGATMGDVDGDGDLDIYVANFSGQQNKLWINDGAGSFTANDIASDLGNSSAAVMGDVDGDGDLDIYVSNYMNEQNKLWINDGTGEFTANNISGDILFSRDAIMEDFDRDGDLDIYVVNDTQQNKIWINDGSGSFTVLLISDALDSTGNSQNVTSGDVDGDGDLDIYVANYGGENNRLWMNLVPAPVTSSSFSFPPQCSLSGPAAVSAGSSVELDWSVEWPGSPSSFYYQLRDSFNGEASPYEGVQAPTSSGVSIDTIVEPVTFELSAVNLFGSTTCTHTVTITPPPVVPPVPEEEVPGESAPLQCPVYLHEYIKIKENNNPAEVEKLELFLNTFEGADLKVDGIYDRKDFRQVVAFQEKYREEILSPWKLLKEDDGVFVYLPDYAGRAIKTLSKGTGHVYISTQKHINKLYCERWNNSQPQ